MMRGFLGGATPRDDSGTPPDAAEPERTSAAPQVDRTGRDHPGTAGAARSGHRPRGAARNADGVRALSHPGRGLGCDTFSEQIGRDVAALAATAPAGASFGVLAPHAGSCRGLHAILRRLPGAVAIAFESEEAVFEAGARTIAALAAPVRLYHGDFRALLGQHRLREGRRVVAFIAPPWPEARVAAAGGGLDPGPATAPPIGAIIDGIERVYGDRPVLYVVALRGHLAPDGLVPQGRLAPDGAGPPAPDSLAALRARFDGSELHAYDLDGPLPERRGALLGTVRW